MDAKDRIIRARSTMLCRFRFFGQLAMYLKPVETETVPTMGTEGKRLYWNREFVNTLSDESLMTVIAHEVLHAAFGHIWRRGSRHPQIYNMAADYVINLTLTGASLTFDHPTIKWLHDEKYKGMCAEEVYDLLIKNARKVPANMMLDIMEAGAGDDDGKSGESSGSGDSDDDFEKKLSATSAKSKCERDWETRIVAAVRTMSERDRGTIPGDLLRRVEELVNPKVNWKQILKRFFTSNSKNDYVMIPPNRRYLHMGLYMPSLDTPSIGDIVVAIDTSCSVSEDELRQFLGEVHAILSAYDCTLHLMYCDASVKQHEIYTRYNLASMLENSEPKGGGGTAFEPVFEKIDELMLRPTVLLYLTDGWGSCPEFPPSYPVMWVLTDRGNSENLTWGEHVELNLDN